GPESLNRWHVLCRCRTVTPRLSCRDPGFARNFDFLRRCPSQSPGTIVVGTGRFSAEWAAVLSVSSNPGCLCGSLTPQRRGEHMTLSFFSPATPRGGVVRISALLAILGAGILTAPVQAGQFDR